jgi:predicted transglutaminase-like cysteine proteinase
MPQQALSLPPAPPPVRGQGYDAPPTLGELMNYEIHRVMDWLDGLNPLAALLVLLMIAAGSCLAFSPLLQPSVPELFGTSGVRINKTPYAEKWARAIQPATHAAAQSIVQQAGAAGTPLLRMASVQRAVHDRIRYVTDDQLYGVSDYWATPNETLQRGAGDCEDVAILKMALLQKLGFNPADMFLTVGYDLALRNGHAVLVVRLNGHFYVLDQLTPDLLQDSRLTEFRPVVTLNAHYNWVHSERQSLTIAAK